MSGNQERTPAADTDPERLETTDEAELLVADPDDYHEAQRLREIHDARQRVTDLLSEIDRYTSDKEHTKQRRFLANAVTAYITELEPLMTQTDYDDELPEDNPWDSLAGFATRMGRLPKEEIHKRERDDPMASYHESMFVYRVCNTFLAEVKPLIQEQENDTWEV